MFQRIRERLIIALIVLLPLHAFLVTVGTNVLLGPGHAPLPWLALWKETLLVIILCAAAYEIFLLWRRGSEGGSRGSALLFDGIDLCVIALLSIALVVSSSPLHSTPSFLYGFKYDLFPLIVFLVLRRVPWSDAFRDRTMRALLVIGSIVAGYGLLTLVFSTALFTRLGYSDLHSLYVPDAPLAAFQQISGTAIRRIQSTMSGPNQLGVWLLIPWGIGLMSLFCRTSRHRARAIVPFLLMSIALVLTFSRSAWIAAFIMGVVALWRRLAQPWFRQMFISLLAACCVLLIGLAIVHPVVLSRVTSTREHALRPLRALQTIVAHPLGLGLGAAGPASNRMRDACVFLDAGANARWAEDHPELCVFAGGTQLQPKGRACVCPFLPENWYLQIGVELGVLGLVLFVALIVLVLYRLRQTAFSCQLSTFSFLSFLGISIAALVLHAWEDSAVAYSMWILAAVVLSSPTSSVRRESRDGIVSP